LGIAFFHYNKLLELCVYMLKRTFKLACFLWYYIFHESNRRFAIGNGGSSILRASKGHGYGEKIMW
jgi:hypothetical protein